MYVLGPQNLSQPSFISYKTLSLKFGKSIAYETFDASKKDVEWAQWVKAKTYALKSN